MDIYHYAEDTKEFINQTKARPNPLEEGEFLIPAKCTTVAPPAFGANEAAVFDPDTGQWSVVPDFRGTYYDQNRQEQEVVLGQVPDPSWVTDIDSVPLTLDELREVKRVEIEAHVVLTIGQATTDIDTVEEIRVIAKLWPALVTANFGPDMLLARDIYVYGRNKLQQLATATRTQIENYDPTTDPNWPS